MRFLKEVITTSFAILVIAVYTYIRSSNLKMEDIDLLLIGALFGFIPSILVFGWGSRIKKLISKPKLEFKATIEEDSFKLEEEDVKESSRITFWIHVRNAGNDVAENCRIRLKMTDLSGRKKIVDKTTYPNVDEDVSLFWLADQKQEFRDMQPSKYFDSVFKIPFVMEFFPEDNSDDFINKPVSSMYFIEPIKKPFPHSLFTFFDDKKLAIGLLIEVIITSKMGEIARQRFALRLEPSPISFDLIKSDNQ